MKALFKYILALAATPMLWSCTADEGTEPGSDPNPVVTLYTYAPTAEGTNPDNDVIVRFVTNSKTSEVKYLAVPSADIANVSEADLIKKVESEGKVLDNLKADSYTDITLTDLHGDYTVVAVANGAKLGNSVTFTGLEWESFKNGTFSFENNIAPVESTECTLEKCTNQEGLYRLNGIFGTGTNLKLELMGVSGEDEDGKYELFRVKQTATPWTYGNYGIVSVRDVGYWQNNAAFVADGSGYANYLYEDGYIAVCLQWNVTAGNAGYNYSYFEPNE